MPTSLKEKIIEILREVMSGSENRDWSRELHTTKGELEIMRNNNDNDFLTIADQLSQLFSQTLKEVLPEEYKIRTNEVGCEYGERIKKDVKEYCTMPCAEETNSCLQEIRQNLKEKGIIL